MQVRPAVSLPHEDAQCLWDSVLSSGAGEGRLQIVQHTSGSGDCLLTKDGPAVCRFSKPELEACSEGAGGAATSRPAVSGRCVELPAHCSLSSWAIASHNPFQAAPSKVAAVDCAPVQ